MGKSIFGNILLKTIDPLIRVFELDSGNYDDMFGEIRSGITGATSWNLSQIRDTGFILGHLRNNSSDLFQTKIQPTHRRQLQSVVADFHIHAYFPTAVAQGKTIVFNVSWVWLLNEALIPDIANWTVLPITWTADKSYPQYSYKVLELTATIQPPANEGYGGEILIKVVRGNGTWTGELGIIDSDVHSRMNKFGSINPFTD